MVDRMPFQAGRIKTGGRKTGVINKRTRQQQAEVARSGLNPVDYMLSIMRDKRQPADRRDRMAAAVAPYTNPKLAVIDSTIRAEVAVSALSEAELREKARALIREAFRERPRVIEHEPRVIAGRDVSADVSAQANGEQSDEREG
jgi:hypothetical protein